MNTVTVYAKERGRIPADLPNCDRILDVALFDVTIPPPTPLRIGQEITIKALTNEDETSSLPSPRTPAQYDAVASDIAGRIVGIRSMEKTTTEFIIQNNVPHALAEHAYLSIHHIEGVTVRLSWWWWALRMVLLPLLPQTRHIALEQDVDITPRSYVLRRYE